VSVVLALFVACKPDGAHNKSSDTASPSAHAAGAMASITRPDTLLQVGPETLAVSAKDPAATEQIARIEPYRARLDSLLDTKEPAVHFYARLAKDDQNGCIEPIDSTVVVPDPKEWPENIESSLVVVVEQGHVLAVREFPFSCSGDWAISYTHTFDATGATVSFERFSGFFNGCPRTTHEHSTYYFSPLTGSLLAKRYSITDYEGNAFSPSLCGEFNYHYPYSIFLNWHAAARGLHLPSVIL
jgi:hypothetical protein